jgi:hypothetical protein
MTFLNFKDYFYLKDFNKRGAAALGTAAAIRERVRRLHLQK